MNLSLCEILRRNQDGTSEYVQSFLKDLKINFTVDSYGNIYSMEHDNIPIMSAHMDTVRKNTDFCIGAFLSNQEENEKIFTGGILGGDDKCGVYIILKLLQNGKKVNFVFSRDEEIGCLGIRDWVKDLKIVERLKTLPYGLVLDRRGNTDIICSENSYGTKEFENDLVGVSETKVKEILEDGSIIEKNKYIYKPERGLCSDANTISNYISCANLSVGYYSPHSEKEYIIRADLETAYDYVCDIIESLKGKTYTAPDKTSSWSGYNYKSGSYYNRYSHSYYGYYDDDYLDDEFEWYLGKNFDKNKKNKNEGKDDSCVFCGYFFGDEETVDFELPNGAVIKVCEYCLEDIEREVKEAKRKFKLKSDLKQGKSVI